MKKLIYLISISMLMLLTHTAWSYSLGFESSNPDTVMHFIQSNNALVYLSAFFGLGLLLAFTPCVLPMVPILSGIIIGQKSLSTGKAFKLSLSYVIGMAITYAAAGMLAGFMGSTIQTMMQRPSVIIGFSIIFILMAASMFGLFELRLPTGLTNKLSSLNQSKTKQNYLSVGLMGVLSTLVVSPCVTAPLIGVLSYIGQNGQVLMGGLILFVMALGMGIPLLIVGSGYGSVLPKTGGWMIKIKQFFGLIMLALAIWMLSRILSDFSIKVLWASLLIIGSISFGSLKSPHNKFGYGLQGLGLLAIIYGGIIFYNLGMETFKPVVKEAAVDALFIKANSLSAIQDKLAQAQKENKVAFLEFSAGWCQDCVDMDAKVFNQPEVAKAMAEFVAIKADISSDTPEVEAIKKHFAIYGTPTLLFFDTHGKPIKELEAVGFVPKDDLLKLLGKAHQLLS
jgi:thiol:disulfide interchange protein